MDISFDYQGYITVYGNPQNFEIVLVETWPPPPPASPLHTNGSQRYTLTNIYQTVYKKY